MFIPVSITLGQISVSTTVKLSGTLVAECGVLYEGIFYLEGEEVSVVIDTAIEFHKDAQTPQDVAILLGDEEYTWYIRNPKATSYVEGSGRQSLTGNLTDLKVGGVSKPLHYGDVGENRTVMLDYGNPGVLLVDLDTGAMKRYDLPATPTDFSVMPEQQMGDYGMYIGVVVGKGLIVLDRDLNHLTTVDAVFQNSNIAAVYAMADMFAVKLVGTTNVFLVSPITGYQNTLGESAYRDQIVEAGYFLVKRDGANVRFQEPGRGFDVSAFSLTSYTTNSYIDASTTRNHYAVIDFSTSVLYVGDFTNVGLATAPVTHYLPDVPSSVLVRETLDSVEYIVGYWDKDAEVYTKSGTGLTLTGTLPTGGTCVLFDYSGSLVSTRLYDSDVVQYLEPEVKETLPTFVEVGKSHTFTYLHTSARPLTAALLSSGYTVTVDNKPFAGFLPPTCTIRITVPASNDYYKFSKVGITGTATVVYDIRTEPKLFDTPKNLTRIYDADIRTFYYDEFTVSGITEGFDVEVNGSTDIMFFRINEGEWVQNGVVKTGDVIQTRWFLKRFGADYTVDNNIVTVHGKSLSIWPILKMELDGAEVPSPVERVQARFETLPASVVAPVEVQVSLGSGTLTQMKSISLEGISDTVAKKYETDLLATFQKYWESSEYSLYGKTNEQSRRMYSDRIQGYVFEPVVEHGFSDKPTITPPLTFRTVQGMESKAIPGTRNATFVEMSSYLPGKNAFTLAYPEYLNKNLANRVHIDARYSIKVSAVSFEAQAGYGAYSVGRLQTGWDITFQGGYSLRTFTPSVDRNVKSEVAYTEPAFGKGVGVEHLGLIGYTQGFRTVNTLEVDRSSEFTENALRFEGGLGAKAIVKSSIRLMLVREGELLSGPGRLSLPVESEWASPVSCAYVLADWGNGTVNKTLVVGADYDRNPPISHFEVSLVAGVLTKAYLDSKPTFHVVESNYKEVEVSGGVLALQEANAYASSLNLGGAEITVDKVGDNYIVRSSPMLETPLCAAGEPPAGKQKDFGYLGGG